MAVVDRLTGEFRSDSGVYYKMTIVDNNSPSSSTSVIDIAENGFELTYQTDTDDRFTGLIPSEVKFDILVGSSFEQAVVDEIRISDYQRFQLKIERSTNDVTYNLFWVGNILNDINSQKDEAFPRSFSLTAICGLSQLSEIDYNENISYLDISTYQTLELIRNALKIQIGTEAIWSASDTYFYSIVDWTNDLIPRVGNVDPLLYTRFNPFAFATVNEETGKIKRQTAFELLNGICKAWGARMFQANGYWHFIQVNSYFYMGSIVDVFYRRYAKSGSQLGSGIIDYTKSEGSTYRKLAGSDTDSLPILRKVFAKYDTIKAYDLPFIEYQYGTQTPVAFDEDDGNKPIITWNGYADGVNLVTSTDYDIANTSANRLSIKLGDVTQIDGATINISRLFSNAYNGTSSDFTTNFGVSWTDITHFLRFKLVGSSSTKYCRPVGGNASDWTTSELWGIAPSYPGYGTFFTGVGAEVDTLNQSEYLCQFETPELPFDGTLYLETYCRIFRNLAYLNNDANVLIAPTDTGADKIFIYSKPDVDETQNLQYYVNGASVAGQIFSSSNTPGGVLINNGTDYNVDDLYFGSGPDAAAIGKIESYNGSLWSNSINPTWESYGSGTDLFFTQLLVDEIMKGQISGAEVFNGSIKVTDTSAFYYFNSIEIDGNKYLPYQVTFNANQDTWSGEFYQINLRSSTTGSSTEIIEFTEYVDNTLQTLTSF